MIERILLRLSEIKLVPNSIRVKVLIKAYQKSNIKAIKKITRKVKFILSELSYYDNKKEKHREMLPKYIQSLKEYRDEIDNTIEDFERYLD